MCCKCYASKDAGHLGHGIIMHTKTKNGGGGGGGGLLSVMRPRQSDTSHNEPMLS